MHASLARNNWPFRANDRFRFKRAVKQGRPPARPPSAVWHWHPIRRVREMQAAIRLVFKRNIKQEGREREGEEAVFSSGRYLSALTQTEEAAKCEVEL